MEYKNDRFDLNLLCEFRDKTTESDFLENEKAANSVIIRFLILLVGFIFAMFTISDYYYSGDQEHFIISLGLRGAALIITIIAFSLTGKFNDYKQTLLMVTLTELAIFIIFILNLYNQKNYEPSVQFMSMMLLILIVFLIPNRWKNCMIAGGTMLIVYMLFCLIFQKTSEAPSLTQRGIYLFTCLLACSLFLYGRESSERKHFAADKLMEYMSITDKLTGIYNRSRFEHILGLWIKNMRHDPFCLVLFDIDDFKKINDTLGHSAGDQVLIGMAEIVTVSIRDDDVFARWGGEEFVILFGNTPIDRARELAERVRKAVEKRTFPNVGSATISAGVTQYRRGEAIADLVNRADEKMYKAKKSGKNRVMAEDPATEPHDK